jgi:hypothetical protein
MKKTILILPAKLLALAWLTTAFPAAAVGPFLDDFESGLGQWTGRPSTAYSGQLMPDPLSSGHGQVLCFTNLNSGGDLFVSNPIALSGLVNVSFDYLGLPALGGAPGDLGGFLGIIYSPTATTQANPAFLDSPLQIFPGGTRGFYHFIMRAS